MTQTMMNYPNELQETITSFEGFFDKNGVETSTSKNAFGSFKQIDFDAAEFVSRSSGIDIDELIASYDDDEEAQSALTKGREWVAEQYYQGKQSIKALRLRKGLSQKQLAELIGSQQSHVCRIEKGTEDIRLSTIEKLATALETEIETIVGIMSSRSC